MWGVVFFKFLKEVGVFGMLFFMWFKWVFEGVVGFFIVK